MIVYFDTSAFLPLLVQESGTDLALRLWREAAHVVSSRLIVAESAAAIAMAHRMGRIADGDHDLIQSEASGLTRELALLDVTADAIDRAAVLAPRRGLRGYDAVHLATASLLHSDDVVFASGDSALLSAAAAEGIHTVDTARGASTRD